MKSKKSDSPTDWQTKAEMDAVWQRIEQKVQKDEATTQKLHESQKPRKSHRRRLIIGGVIVLLVVVASLGGFFWWRSQNDKQQAANVELSDLIDTSEQMPGVDFNDIPDATKANILSANIEDKAEGYVDYDAGKAMADYKQVYDKAKGDLKLYVAIEYARYVYDNKKDLDQAVKIMDSVKGEMNDGNKVDYYSAFVSLYTEAGNEEKASEYRDLLVKASPNLNLNESEV